MIILSDTRQQEHKHDLKEKWFAENGIEVRRTKLYVGDYTLPVNQSICIDTKRDLQELCGNVCGPQHDRFRNELIRAQEAGIKLIILVENKPEKIGRTGEWNPMIHTVEDLHKWRNPRLFIWERGKQKYPRATRGITLQKACMTLQNKYGCTFVFCSPEDAGKKIVEILTNGTN